MTVRCLAKKRKSKVGVKNKENKTACFIKIEGLLNSLELISDLPGLEIEEQQGQGSWENMSGGEKGSSRSCLCSGIGCRDCGRGTVFRGAVGS